ncbi:MAG: hypothetical protein GQ549_07245, partial [Gammaproteobacteria bacterium]|nr:hypothetical protein [Gammaproteobacteria bacterium]
SKNIADRDVLVKIAESCDIDKETVDSAWTDEKHQQCLLDNFNSARKHEIQSVPSFVFGDRVLTGVVAESTFRDAAEQLAATSS